MSAPHQEQPRVLIGFAEALAAVEVTRSLRRAGMEVCAFAREDTRPVVGRLLHKALHRIPSPERGVDAAVGALDQVIGSTRPDLVLPLDDMALWMLSRTSQTQRALPDRAGIEFALDKRLQLSQARAAGFQVPPTQVLDDRESAARLSGFPLVLRPALAARPVSGRLGRASGSVCADGEELDTALRAWSGTEPLLAQPYIAGVGEGLFACAERGELHSASAHRRVRMMNPQGSGASACTPVAVDPALLGPATRLVRSVGWEGMFMIELLRDEAGTPWFVEWNGRAWGSMALGRRQGLEYPAWTAQAALGQRPDYQAAAQGPPFLCRHAGRELVHVLQVMRGPRSAAVRNWPSRWRTLRDVLHVRRTDRWYNLEQGDWRLFLVDAFRSVAGQLRARRRNRS